MPDSPIDIVQRFCDAWSDGEIDVLMSFFADDAVYHNIPVAPVAGVAAIRETIAGFTTGVDEVKFEVRHIAAVGDVVLTERVDVFRFPNTTISLPVSGTFELQGGKIVAWRDYFDLNQFMSQLPTRA